MPKPLVVMFADSHLQHGAWANRPILGDSYHSLKQIVDYAIANKVEAVIGAGDLLDKQRNRSAPINFFHSQLDRLELADIRFYFIEGQHDYDDPSWLSGHRWAFHLNGQSMGLGAFNFYGLNYQPHGLLQQCLDEIPDDTDVLVAHQVWGNWMGDVAAPQGEFAHIPVVSRVFTGDLHKYKLEDAKGKDGQDMKVCSPGSTCMQEISEPAGKFFVTFSAGGEFSRVKLLTRRVIDWPVMNLPADVDNFAADFESEIDAARNKAEALELPPELQTPILRVTYAAKLQDVVRRVEKVVGQRAHLFFKENIPEERVAKAKAAKAEKGDAVTPLSELPREVDEEKEPEVYSLCHRLLTAEAAGLDPAEELLKWRAEYMEQG